MLCLYNNKNVRLEEISSQLYFFQILLSFTQLTSHVRLGLK